MASQHVSRFGKSVVELLVALGIITILVSLMAPAAMMALRAAQSLGD